MDLRMMSRILLLTASVGSFVGLGAEPAATRESSLFPSDLPGPEWVQFTAQGFSKPVTGVVYRDGTTDPGIPLGGLGTGFISLDTNGTLDYYSTIFNAFMERHYLGLKKDGKDEAFFRHRSDIPTLQLPFLGLSVGDRTQVLTLKEVEGVPGVKQIHYWGHYPVADLEYEVEVPLAVRDCLKKPNWH